MILDVVYNHLGPEGNYAGNFGPYFTDRYRTPWGKAINYDGADSDPVRQFVIDNARMWVRDFHVDGLRLDAVQTIYDFSPRHILADIQAAVQREAAAAQRLVHVIAETNQNDVRLVRPREQGGYGLDGVWSDDFHHSVHALLTGERDGYYVDFGRPEQLAKAYNDVFVYDGCYSPFHHRRHGTRVGAIDRTRFVVCIQNHDQVGNRVHGDRLGALIVAGRPAAGVRPAAAFALRAAVVHGRGIRRDEPLSVLLLVRRSGDRRGGAARPARGVRRLWRSSGEAEIPDPQAARDFCRGQARLELAGRLAAGADCGNCIRTCWRHAATGRRCGIGGRLRLVTKRSLAVDAGRPNARCERFCCSERGGDDGLLAVANLTAGGRVRWRRSNLGGGDLLLSTEDVRYGGCAPQRSFAARKSFPTSC